ncbi:MAG: peptidylprolyl isomerase [Fibromonadaceae bacterium]|jgi:peptidyl-prolyl cis-trans isomerase SurA|nr:peptidylprolyl isomerase [Fibromonadaceae bacterium]
MFRILLALFVCVSSLFAAGAVKSEPILLESIVAVVDGKVILRSDLMTQLYQYQAAPGFMQLPEHEQMSRVLDKIIEEKVLLSRITRDSITVDDAELSQRVDMHVKGLAARQGASVAALENAIKAQLGISMSQYREKLMERFKDEMMLSRIRQKHVGIINPTRKEVEEFYSVYKDSIPRQYDCLLFSVISIPVEPGKNITDSVRNVAMNLIDSLDRGIHFSVLAKNHSQNSSIDTSAYLRRGSGEPEYERAAMRLGIGEWTDYPILTKEGWNIIRLLGKKDEGLKTSNILLRVEPSNADSSRALHRLDSLKKEIEKGSVAFSKIAAEFSKDRETSYRGGSLGWQERKAIDPDYSRIISSLKPGEVSGPEFLQGTYRILRLDSEAQVREYNLEEDYTIIENMTSSYMSNLKLQSLIDQWRNEVYIDIRL